LKKFKILDFNVFFFPLLLPEEFVSILVFPEEFVLFGEGTFCFGGKALGGLGGFGGSGDGANAGGAVGTIGVAVAPVKLLTIVLIS
jgi:hypothetical protein